MELIELVTRVVKLIVPPIKRLPAETLSQIFSYLQYAPLWLDAGYKPDLYHAALACRDFSLYAIPLLWRSFTFSLYEGDDERPQYQTRFLESLTPESSRNFVYTRQLSVHLTMYAIPITDCSQCAAILSNIERFLGVYSHVGAYLKSLDLRVEPFIPTDCVHDGLWPILSCCNDRIYHLLGQVMAKDCCLESLSLEVGREAWRYDEEFRPHVQHILWMLGPKITELTISEHSQFLGLWVPTMRRLRKIVAFNIGEFDENESTSLWKAISQLPVTETQLLGFPLPANFPSYISSSLTNLCLRGLDDIVTAIVVCYTQLPSLVSCALNQGRVKDPETARATMVKQTVCTKLTQVCFLNSFTPVGLVGVIAKNNPGLDFIGAPPNISDDDMCALATHCKYLQIVELSKGGLNEITPHIQLTKRGLDHLPKMGRLSILSLDYHHARFLDKEFLSALARNAPSLWLFDFSLPKDQPREFNRSRIRDAFSGTDEYKDWILDFVREGEFGRNPWQIKLRDILVDTEPRVKGLG